MSSALIALAACSARGTTTAPSTQPHSQRPGWGARVAITLRIPNTTPLADFPVPIRITAERVDYARIAADGHDLRFTDGSGVDLPYEIERFGAAQASWIWVRIPKLEPGVDAHVMLYFDNPKAPYLAPAEAREVWTNGFGGVFHLQQELADSSPSQAPTSNVGMAPADGVVGPARFFSSKHVDTITSTVAAGDGDRTLCAWASSDTVDPGAHLIAGYGDGTGFALVRDGWSAKCGGSVIANAFEVGAWRYVCCVRRGDTATIYVDGVAGTSGAAAATSTGPLRIGGLAAPPSRWAGVIDEVRLSSVARDPDWLVTELRSMKTDVATFGPIERQ